MADPTTNTNPWINASTSLLGNWLTNRNIGTQQNALNQGLAQSSNYIDSAYNRAATLQQPYIAAGQTALPQYMTVASQVGSPLTTQQFESSPYYQVGMNAAQQGADALRGQGAASGMYGSGNMANALQKNAQSTMLGAYDTAANRQLQNQQASANALWTPAALGQASASNLGGLSMEAAKYQAGLAQTMAQNNASAAYGKSGNLQGALQNLAGMLPTLGGAAQNLYNKYLQGQAMSTEEQAQFDDLLAQSAAATPASYYDGLLGGYSEQPTGIFDISPAVNQQMLDNYWGQYGI